MKPSHFLTLGLLAGVTAQAAVKIEPNGGEIGQAKSIDRGMIEHGRGRNGGEIGQAKFKLFESTSKGLRFEQPSDWHTMESTPLLIISDLQSFAPGGDGDAERIHFIVVESQIQTMAELHSELQLRGREWSAITLGGKLGFSRTELNRMEIWLLRKPGQLLKIGLPLGSDSETSLELAHLLNTLEIRAD
jgi:hypothetical protein